MISQRTTRPTGSRSMSNREVGRLNFRGILTLGWSAQPGPFHALREPSPGRTPPRVLSAGERPL